MKNKNDLLRKMSIILSYVMAVLMIAMTIIGILTALTEKIPPFNTSEIITFGVIGIFFFVMAEKRRARGSKIKKTEDGNEKLRDFFFVSKKCPSCSARLAVCEKPEMEGAVPELNVADSKLESLYYCPICKKTFDSGEPLEGYEREDQKFSAVTGKQYFFRNGILQQQINKKIWVYGCAGVLFVALATWFLWSGKAQNFVFYYLIAFLMGVIGVTAGYLFAMYLRLLKATKQVSYEVRDDGLVLRDAHTAYLYKWGEFRMKRKLSDGSYGFDTAQGAFMLTPYMENFEELLAAVLEKIEN